MLMNSKINFPEENKKRAAFKRFSQMSAAGLAVISMSAFTDVAAKQLPANVENGATKEQHSALANMLTDNTFAIEEVPWVADHGEHNDYGHYDYSNYCNYNNNYNNQYSNNYANYSNNYGDYSNNYSNYGDSL